jgi:hypothetical protein
MPALVFLQKKKTRMRFSPAVVQFGFVDEGLDMKVAAIFAIRFAKRILGSML